MNWNKAKDILLVALLSIGVKIMHGSMSDLTNSVKDLNIKMSAYITKTDTNSSEIDRLRTDLGTQTTRINEVEINLYRHHPKE